MYTVGDVEFVLDDPDASTVRESVPGHSYEPGTVAVLNALLRRGKHSFADIGALYGYFAVYAAKLNPACAVHAFEPNPEFAAVLRANVATNGVGVSCEEVALQERAGTALLREKAIADRDPAGGMVPAIVRAAARSARDLGAGRRGRGPRSGEMPATRTNRGAWLLETLRYGMRGPARRRNAVSVRSTSYDEWARRQRTAPDVAKIDVHGAEGMVLAGMKEALRTDLRTVLIEVHAPGMLLGYDHRQLVDMLTEAGLRIYEVEDFRTSAAPIVTPLDNARLRRFVDPRGWSLKELTLMRMLVATREQAGAIAEMAATPA